MGADQTPDPTAWSDDELDNLLDQLAQRAAERDDLDLPGSGASRRTVLAALLGAGGLGIGATQLGAAASWGSASGTVGTQSTPMDQANIRDLDAKLLEAEQVSVGERSIDRIGVRAHLSTNQSISSDTPTTVKFDVVDDDDRNEFDATNNKFVAANAGDYFVHSCLEMQEGAKGDTVRSAIMVNGTRERRKQRIKGATADSVAVTSPKLSLNAGDEVTIRVENTLNSDLINADEPFSYLEIIQVA